VNPHLELEKRYPEADFAVYFRHLDACRTERCSGTHEHHICPRKQFPEFADSPENLIPLRVDDHAHAHKLLEAACGIKAPPAALLETSLVVAVKAGSKGGQKTRDNKSGMFARTKEQVSEDARRAGKIGGAVQGKKSAVSGHLASIRPNVETLRKQLAACRTAEHQAKAGAAGGRVSGPKNGQRAAQRNKNNGTGFYSKELQTIGGIAAAHKRWHTARNIQQPAVCSLCRFSF
jgi:hypothetical protein